MGKGDHRKTRELDKAKLAELTERSSDNRTATPGLPAKPDQIAVGRANTLDDPLTTGLLAEVSRRAQTTEFDADAIEALLEAAEDDVAVIIDKPSTHPRVTRRQG
jgi:hypothetical protein